MLKLCHWLLCLIYILGDTLLLLLSDKYLSLASAKIVSLIALSDLHLGGHCYCSSVINIYLWPVLKLCHWLLCLIYILGDTLLLLLSDKYLSLASVKIVSLIALSDLHLGGHCYCSSVINIYLWPVLKLCHWLLCLIYILGDTLLLLLSDKYLSLASAKIVSLIALSDLHLGGHCYCSSVINIYLWPVLKLCHWLLFVWLLFANLIIILALYPAKNPTSLLSCTLSTCLYLGTPLRKLWLA